MKMVANKAEYDEYLSQDRNMPQPDGEGYVEPRSYPCIVGYSVSSWQYETTKTEIIYLGDMYMQFTRWMHEIRREV